jgi:hypothetical protein
MRTDLKLRSALWLLCVGAIGVPVAVLVIRSATRAANSAEEHSDVSSARIHGIAEAPPNQSESIDKPPAGAEGSSGRHTITFYGSSTGVPQLTKPRRKYNNLPFNQNSADGWHTMYSGMTVMELDAARTSIENQLSAIADPILNQMFADGKGTLLSTDTGGYQFSQDDSRDICAIQAQPGVGVYRVALAREEYPELYQLKELSLWLGYEITGRVREAAHGIPSGDR